MTRRPGPWLLSALFVSTVASAALAHITLVEPAPRHPSDELKLGPCGAGAGDARATDPALITTYQAGQSITVRWIETVDHPSHFRISLATSDTGFVDPTGFDDTSGGESVLIDDIADTGGPAGEQYELEVTLPNEPCPSCTLQLIQVMQDKPPWGDGNDIYYQCADLVIQEGPVSASGGATSSGGSVATGGSGLASTGGQASGAGDDSDDDSEGGCQLGAAGPSPAGVIGSLGLLVSAWALRRRRTRTA